MFVNIIQCVKKEIHCRGEKLRANIEPGLAVIYKEWDYYYEMAWALRLPHVEFNTLNFRKTNNNLFNLPSVITDLIICFPWNVKGYDQNKIVVPQNRKLKMFGNNFCEITLHKVFKSVFPVKILTFLCNPIRVFCNVGIITLCHVLNEAFF